MWSSTSLGLVRLQFVCSLQLDAIRCSLVVSVTRVLFAIRSLYYRCAVRSLLIINAGSGATTTTVGWFVIDTDTEKSEPTRFVVLLCFGAV